MLYRIIVLMACIVVELQAFCEPSWLYAPIFSIATMPSGIKERHRELAAGISLDSFMWQGLRWRTGPGMALMVSLPLNTGNNFVRVWPYKFYAEPRWTWWLVLGKNNFSVMPFVGLKSLIGAEFIRRRVATDQSTNALWLAALGSRVGIAYWLYNWGLLGSYDVSMGTFRTRQELNFSLTWLL